MSMGKWLSSLTGLFKEGPMKEMAETVEQPEKVAAEDVRITDEFRQRFSERKKLSEQQRTSFLFSLLVMASYVVLADGRADEAEYAYMSKFLGNNFGPDAEAESMDVLRKLVSKHEELAVNRPNAFLQMIGQCGLQMADMLSEELRYQLLSMLVMIVKSDGIVDIKEISALKDAALYMGLKDSDVDALLVLDESLAKEGWPDLNI